MSRVITRNALARTHANSELPRATPPDLPNTHDYPLVPPITSPPAPVCPSHTEEHVDDEENPLPRTPETPRGPTEIQIPQMTGPMTDPTETMGTSKVHLSRTMMTHSRPTEGVIT